jgi:hypothetical protein
LDDVRSATIFPSDFKQIDKVHEEAVIEQLAIAPSTCQKMTTGHCALVDASDRKVLTFIPPAILRVVGKNYMPKSLLPCGKALLMLAEAVDNFQTNRSDPGKAWEKVILAALLLHARSNKFFLPSTFCRSDLCGIDVATARLIGGESGMM